MPSESHSDTGTGDDAKETDKGTLSGCVEHVADKPETLTSGACAEISERELLRMRLKLTVAAIWAWVVVVYF